MDDVRDRLEALLDHPVGALLPPLREGAPWVVASVGGDPRRARIAWIDLDRGRVRARVACPPGIPSRWRPVVAAEVTLESAEGAVDHVLVARLAPQAEAALPVLAQEEDPPPEAAGPGGLVLVRVPLGVLVVAVDALAPGGEPIGRLDRVGIADLRTSGGAVGGRLGVGHGMAAGIGHGRWVEDLGEAAFEAGYQPLLPEWLPPGLVQSRPRIEPDLAYPAAPPAVIVTWSAEDGGRVLLRQAPAPLATPDPGGAWSRTEQVAGVDAVVRGRRGFWTVVWETGERAFGVQVQRMDDGEAVALAVARSIPEA